MSLYVLHIIRFDTSIGLGWLSLFLGHFLYFVVKKGVVDHWNMILVFITVYFAL